MIQGTCDSKYQGADLRCLHKLPLQHSDQWLSGCDLIKETDFFILLSYLKMQDSVNLVLLQHFLLKWNHFRNLRQFRVYDQVISLHFSLITGLHVLSSTRLHILSKFSGRNTGAEISKLQFLPPACL